eukprot:4572917-Prymnesium_polylepis.1
MNLAPNTERVKWVIHYDPLGNPTHEDYDERRRCKHVNLISNSHVMDDQGRPREAEYLFAPYSVFTVRSVQWGSGDRPKHEIDLEPVPDNLLEDNDLPLAPWY